MAAAAGARVSKRAVVIDDVKFDGPIHLQDAVRERLVDRLKGTSFDADSDWLDEVQFAWIGGAWQDEGFFKATATARAQIVGNSPAAQHVLLIVHVDEGLQYRLGDVQFRSTDPDSPLVFSDEQLRELLSLREGDLFSAEKIREALDAMKKLYGTYGYIDFVVTPTAIIADDRPRISLVMEIDQQKQFRVGTVEILGLDPKMANLLKSKLTPGDVFNSQLVENFLSENRSALPRDVSLEDVDVHRDVRSGTVDLRFNFQTCPQVQN